MEKPHALMMLSLVASLDRIDLLWALQRILASQDKNTDLNTFLKLEPKRLGSRHAHPEGLRSRVSAVDL